jgi:ABC-2 type transport system ATP-binding protein
MIAASHLSRQFGGRTVVRDLSLDVAPSEIVALLGPNGAGKTTTLRMLAGLIAPTSGTIAIDGIALTPATAASLRGRIGFLTETPGLWDRLTVRENLAVYGRLFGLDPLAHALDEAIETLDLRACADTRAGELSKGMRQKAALARALLHRPSVLLLDEPTSGLDPQISLHVRTLLESRRAAGCSILVSTHNLDEAERLADRVAVLQESLLALDRPAALRRQLMTGRIIVRITPDPTPYLEVARAFDAGAIVEGGAIVLHLPDGRTPSLVAALVGASAEILEVRAEIPPLEDAYLHVMRGRLDGR